MKKTQRHSFELVLRSSAGEGEFLESVADTLIDAGCDDATFSVRYGTPHAEFSREAPSFATAVASAIAQIESVPAVHVARVVFDELLTASEMARRLGRSRQSVQQLIAADRGPGGFPAPASWVVGAKVWEWSEVARWARERLGLTRLPVSEEAEFVAALNGVLDARSHLRRIRSPEEAELVSALLHQAS